MTIYDVLMYIQTSSDLKLSPVTGKRKWVEPDSDSDYIESDDDDDDIDNKGGVLIDADNLTEQGLIRPLPKKVSFQFYIFFRKSFLTIGSLDVSSFFLTVTSSN